MINLGSERHEIFVKKTFKLVAWLCYFDNHFCQAMPNILGHIHDHFKIIFQQNNLGFLKKMHYSKTCLQRPLKKDRKLGFQDRLSLNAGQKYCRMLQESILQYFRHALSYHLSLRPLFCLFLSGRLRRFYCNAFI